MTRWLAGAGAVWAVALVSVAGQPGRPSFPGTIDSRYTSFTGAERQAVLAIVRETVKGWS